MAPSRRRRNHAKLENLAGENEKKEDDNIKMEELHQHKVSQMIKKCGRQCWTLACHHEAHSMERRSTDLEERRTECQAVGSL